MANGIQMAKQLLQVIQKINRTRIPPQHRLQIAELFTQPIAYAISTQEKNFIDASFPLSDKAHLVTRMCARLNEELAIAYKITVHDIAMTKIGNQERKLLIVALFRAVYHLAEVVYRTTLLYRPVPRHLWRELHHLFAFAEGNRWSATRVKILGNGEAEAEAEAGTLRDRYVQILLFAAADPYRIRQREIRALYLTLPSWCSKVRFGPATDPSPADTRFIVQLKKEQPALHSALLRTPPEKPAVEINTEPLIQALRELHKEMPPESPGVQPGAKQKTPSRGTMSQLIRVWGSGPKRRPERTQLNFDLEVSVGLSRIYSLVSQEADPAQSAPASFGIPQNEDRNMDSALGTDLGDSDSGLLLMPMEGPDGMFVHGDDHSDMLTEQEYTSPPPIWKQEEAAKTDSPTTAGLQTINESAGGYCIRWSGPDAPGIKLGELVSIQAADNPAEYGLAVARWMRCDPNRGLKLGVQLIAHQLIAVTATTAERRRRTPTQCLLVPELKSTHRPASLVAPVLPFEVGMELHISHGEEEKRVRLVRLLESTAAYAQFELEYE